MMWARRRQLAGLAGEGEPGRLLADHDIPQAEVDLDVAAGLKPTWPTTTTGRADLAPARECAAARWRRRPAG